MSRASVAHFKRRQQEQAAREMAGLQSQQGQPPRIAVSFHASGMPPHILRLFEAPAELEVMKLPRRRKQEVAYSGVGEYVKYFDENGGAVEAPPPLPMDTGTEGGEGEAGATEPPLPLPNDEGEVLPGVGELEPGEGLPPPVPEEESRLFLNAEMNYQVRVDGPTKIERMIQRLEEKKRRNEEANEEALKLWNPSKDPNVEGDAMHTLFVGGLSEDVSERKLQREFESFGPIRRVRVVHDRMSGKSKGYGFVEFEEKDDMKEAYKQAYGQRIEGKRCVVDVERGRTVPDWRPKRLGGGAFAGKRLVCMLPKNWKKAAVKKVVFNQMGMEVREPRSDRGMHGGYGGYGGYAGKRGNDGRGDGSGYHSRDRGMAGYRRDDWREDRRGGYGGRRDYDHRDDRNRGYGGRDDRRGGDRGYGGSGRREYGRDDRRRDDRRDDWRDERGRYDDRRRDDRVRDDRTRADAHDRYEYRDPKRERISYDDFAAPAPEDRYRETAQPAQGPAPGAFEHEEGEI